MAEIIEQVITERTVKCKNCGNTDLWFNGKVDGTQYVRCKQCKGRYTTKDTYKGFRHDRGIIMKAMERFYGGMSFGIIKNKFRKIEGIELSKPTIWNWIIHFTNLVIPYVKSLEPVNIGDEWFADETMIKIHGKDKWLWAVLDGDTRYLLGCNFTYTRPIRSAAKLFQEAYYHAGKAPNTIRTDGLPAYIKAFKSVIKSRNRKAVHLTSKGFGSKSNTNLIERWNEYIKQRTKVLRYFKKPESAFVICEGIITNYNFLWPHSSLGYVPPAVKAGIDLKGLGIVNWGDLIDLALQYHERNPPSRSYMWYLDELERVKNIHEKRRLASA